MGKHRWHFWLFSLSAFILLHKGCCDFFSAMSDMEGLISAVSNLRNHLADYIRDEERRMQQVKGYLAEFRILEQHNETAQQNNTIEQPSVCLKLLMNRMKVTPLFNVSELVKLPTEEDLTGAALGLIRLQSTYQLAPRDLARGRILGKKEASYMTAGDSWELGRKALQTGDDHLAVRWMKESLRQYVKEKVKTIPLEDILEFYAFSSYKIGDYDWAELLTKQLLLLVPQSRRQSRGIFHNAEVARYDESIPPEKEYTNAEEDVFSAYNQLCRGERLLDAQTESRLRCRYTSGASAFLKLQPVKEEEFSHNPHISMFYDVISEPEMELVQKLAQPVLQRATVQDFFTKATRTVLYRISKSAFLVDSAHAVLQKVSNRIADVTGLTTETASDTQVVNYGIGGYYALHYDFALNDMQTVWPHGNRIATWLFYLSDVEGGSTVFPKAKVGVKPVKGAAVFWYNLDPSGAGDMNTFHAGCPVLSGSKWIANKWLHVHGQEFRRRCPPDILAKSGNARQITQQTANLCGYN